VEKNEVFESINIQDFHQFVGSGEAAAMVLRQERFIACATVMRAH
jgi:hypothetical protein